MTAEFIAAPRATSAPFEPTVVALGVATTKTVLQDSESGRSIARSKQ